MTDSQHVDIPAMPNAHSHAFQWLMRGVSEPSYSRIKSKDDFWSWRNEMFKLASTLTPEEIYDTARAAYAEMRAAGYGAVGEFHYLHHQPDGTPYSNPNVIAQRLAEAAIAERLPIVLLPTAYARAGWNQGDLPPAAGQLRFCDPNVDTFLARVDELRNWADSHPGVFVGIAAHSVRAVPASWLRAIADYARQHDLVLHIHSHEQPREITECRAEHGCTPIELLAETGFLSKRTSIIHGIHVNSKEVGLLANSNSIVVSCPTTEGNLGDGYFPALAYHNAGVRIALGSDSQVIIDPFEEIRELETIARRTGQTRSALLARTDDLWGTVCENGCASLGLNEPDVGRVTIDLSSPPFTNIPHTALRKALATCANSVAVEPFQSSTRR